MIFSLNQRKSYIALAIFVIASGGTIIATAFPSSVFAAAVQVPASTLIPNGNYIQTFSGPPAPYGTWSHDYNSGAAFAVSSYANYSCSAVSIPPGQDAYLFFGTNAAVYSNYYTTPYGSYTVADIMAVADYYVKYQCPAGTPVDSIVTNTSTRIDSVTPAGGATIATSTAASLAWTGYINSSDFVASSTAIKVTIQRQTNVAQSSFWTYVTNYAGCIGVSAFSWCPFSGSQGIAGTALATTSGAFSLSTSTPILLNGVYIMTTAITKPLVSFLGFSIGTQTLVSTTTTFIASEKTATDDLISDIASTTAAFSSSVSVGNYCNIIGFDLLNCMSALIVPSSADVSSVFNQAKNGVLAVWPIGYLTRTAVILSGTATSSLPDFSISIPATFPGAGASLDLTPWNEIMGDSSILGMATDTLHAVSGSASGKTIRQIVEPGWDNIVYIVFAIVVLSELLGFAFQFGGEQIEERWDEQDRRRKLFKKTIERDQNRKVNFPWGYK